MATDGFSFTEIGKKFGISKERVRQICKKVGITHKNKPNLYKRSVYECNVCGRYRILRVSETPPLFCSMKCCHRYLKEKKKKKSRYKTFFAGHKKSPKYEHRIVMEKHLGRKLNSNEHVHHIDHDGHNNSIDNLKIVSNIEHSKLHKYEQDHFAGLKPILQGYILQKK